MTCFRNAFLANKGLVTPKTTKTGTTICGAIFDGGVVLGADTRSTSGDIVADKNCMKIHDLAPNMVRFNKYNICKAPSNNHGDEIDQYEFYL